MTSDARMMEKGMLVLKIKELEAERDELKSKIEALECICPSCDKKADKIFEIYDGHKVYTLKCDNCGFAWLPYIQEQIIDYRNLRDMREERDQLAEVNKMLVEDLEKIGHRNEPEHLDASQAFGYMYCCEDVIKDANEILAKAKEMSK